MRNLCRLPGFSRGKSYRIIAAAVLSILALALAGDTTAGWDAACEAQMLEAAQIMERAIAAVSRHRKTLGQIPEADIDPNGTGLIGRELDELTTSLGHLEAKRTTTNPNMAGLIVYLLRQAGIRAGDRIAVGSSGSFPALLIASLAAAEALGARPVAIISLGASSFGATDSSFDLLELYQFLLGQGIVSVAPAAISLGGGGDIGLDFEPDLKDRLMRQISASGIPFLYEPDLAVNVARRMQIYDGAAAFINAGGSHANLGTSDLVLNLKPGLNRSLNLPPEKDRGVIFKMAERGIPIIHLLFIKGLAAQYNLPWDPVPLPRPNATQIPSASRPAGVRFWAVAGLYSVALILLCIPWPIRRDGAVKN